MIVQGPVPPVPPTPPSPPFDPNLVLMQGGPPLVFLIVMAALVAATIILWPIVRALARRLEGKGSETALRGELEQLQSRLTEVDTLHARVAELEERVDFTERLLAQSHDSQGRALRGES